MNRINLYNLEKALEHGWTIRAKAIIEAESVERQANAATKRAKLEYAKAKALRDQAKALRATPCSRYLSQYIDNG
jgi:hypothetical protein